MSKKTSRVPTTQDINERWEGLFNALNHESDFICVVTATSYIEHCLGALLQQHFIEGSTSAKLLDPRGGALGSLSAKSDAAYCLGLISKGCKTNIDVIGSVRNLFAHSIDSPGFADEEIRTLCLTKLTMFKIDQLVTDSAENADPFPDAKTHPRFKFVMISSVICSTVMMKALATDRVSVLNDMWPD